MPDRSPDDLQAIAAERAAMFRPAWFARLIRGDLPLGETFWVGHLGVQLVLMPVWLVLVVLIPALAPGLSGAVIGLFLLVEGAWSILVSRAVILVAPGSHGAGLWRWVAILFSLLATGQLLVLSVLWAMGRI